MQLHEVVDQIMEKRDPVLTLDLAIALRYILHVLFQKCEKVKLLSKVLVFLHKSLFQFIDRN